MTVHRPPHPPIPRPPRRSPVPPEPSAPAPREDITRELLMRLANAELERAKWLPVIAKHAETIADGVNLLVALARRDGGTT